jgi:hypothetical protein
LFSFIYLMNEVSHVPAARCPDSPAADTIKLGGGDYNLRRPRRGTLQII